MTQLDVLNPATNEVIESIDYTSHEDIDAKIERAYNAFQTWRFVDAHERSAKLFKWVN